MGKVKIHFTGKEMDYVAKEENRMTEVAKRIEKLRALMAEQNIDAYVVPTADFHQSEYVGEHFKARKFITGFSGSYGTAVIAKDDGRSVDRWKIFHTGTDRDGRQWCPPDEDVC
mgnify:FL=1